MFDEKRFQDFINGIGSMAEIQILYFNTLLEKGVEKDVATSMSSAFIKTLLEIGLNQNGD